jgi:hypothetical protein
MADLNAFIAQYNGQTNVGDTDANRGQCVGLIEVWTDALGEPHTWGNADQLLADADQSAFDVIFNTPSNFPSPGDIVVWGAGWEGSRVGHCAIATDANAGALTVFEQNDRLDGGDGACRVFTLPTQYSGVLGWLHPHALDAPPPAPAPEPSVPASAPSVPPVVPTPSVPVPTPSVAPSEPVITQTLVGDNPPSTGSADLPAPSNWFVRFLKWLIGDFHVS